jgi:hypothetical protein
MIGPNEQEDEGRPGADQDKDEQEFNDEFMRNYHEEQDNDNANLRCTKDCNSN